MLTQRAVERNEAVVEKRSTRRPSPVERRVNDEHRNDFGAVSRRRAQRRRGAPFWRMISRIK